ncbi:Suppressor of fused protein (SUFU) [Actinopolyspora mzabensis]|uniref:Suppressor of fused protein (SUFU) n=1 Tax=Actinopolyspora mzabensis TaxID=995066 RepID=A0A1G9C623_ACTMZ|nr:suppressor of fused domain protein [Actinopolyspora mzabensis]SDK47120.1 Suppressor of fused protein (SUFU) [Actinopolyspora mzabensis]
MSRFSEFPAHVEHYLGRIRGADSPEAGSRERGYHLVYCDPPHGGHISVLTSGLRSRTAGAPLPHELVCTLHHGQELYARHLTGVVAELLEESNSRVGPGALIMNDRALLPDTSISGALAAPHPYLGEDFDVVRDGSGEAVLRLITLLPISRGESQLVARYGSDVLYDRWQEQETDLLDIFRPSVA